MSERNGGISAGQILILLLLVVGGYTLLGSLSRNFGRGLAEGGFDGRVLSPGHDISQESGDGANSSVVIGDRNQVGQTVMTIDGTPVSPAASPAEESNPFIGWGALVLSMAVVALALWMWSVIRSGNSG